MRRTEALQGVRMAMFLNILNRWESAELNQEEAAELLGVSERTFRRWTRRYEEEGEAGLLDRRLGKASGKRVPAIGRKRWSGFIASATRVSRSSISTSIWSRTTASAGATPGTKLHLQWAGVVREGAAQGGAPQEARAAARCRG